MPLGGAKSGLHVVTVKDGTVTPKFYDFGDLPRAALIGTSSSSPQLSPGTPAS